MQRRETSLLIAPAVILITVFMVLPLLIALGYSVMTSSPYGGVLRPVSGEGYFRLLFERDFDGTILFTPDYLWIVVRSVLLAFATSILCLGFGFPVAWYIVCQSPRRRTALLFCVSLPFWVNTLIRTYSWILLLRDEGLVNVSLRSVGIIEGSIPFLYNYGAVLLGLAYTFLPFMVLPIYSTLERIDPRLIEASHDLYANRIATLRRVVWPLARPGAMAGAVLVFAPALGSFLAPDLLGGGRRLLIGSLIQLEFTSGRDWAFGAALSTLITLGALAALWYLTRKRALFA